MEKQETRKIADTVFFCCLLSALFFGLVPVATLAQQPIMTIKALDGDVLVSGNLVATIGTVLHPGDSIQTLFGSHVNLELSDGSHVEVAEKTSINIAELVLDPQTGARNSHILLTRGRIRATLSRAHRQKGCRFHVETPNALIGILPKQPDVEVAYDAEMGETVILTIPLEVMTT
jgi:hypothetical protein